MSNEVHVDPAALAAEAEAVVASAPASSPIGPAIDSEQVEAQLEQQLANASWDDITRDTVDMLSVTVFQQWNLTEKEIERFSRATASCLAQVFPDGVGGAAMPWIRLILCGGGICIARAVGNGGKLPPLGPRKAVTPSANASAPNPSAN